jgi:hypothetical protein
MCLDVRAVPQTPNKVSADRLSKVSGLHVRKLKENGQAFFWFTRAGGCSCALMPDGANPTVSGLLLEEDVLEGLAKGLELLAKEAGGVTFEAVWPNDDSSSESRVTRSEMLASVRENRLRTNHSTSLGNSRCEQFS